MVTIGKRRSQAGGATLVEVMVAVGILAVALIPLLAMLSMGIDTNRKAINITVATRIADRLLASAQQGDWANLSALEGYQLCNDTGLIAMSSQAGAGADETAVYTAKLNLLPTDLVMGVSSSNPVNPYARKVRVLVASGVNAQSRALIDAALQALNNKTKLPPEVYVSNSLLVKLEKD